MRTSTTNLIAILTIGAVALAANSATACGGYSKSYHKTYYHKTYSYPVKTYYEPTFVYDQCYHPQFSFCTVYPGDTWYTLAKRCYGHGNLWKHIATYNRLGFSSSVLVPGQQLQLPVVNANGTLTASNAPAPAGFAPQGASFGPQGTPVAPQAQSMAPQGTPNGLSAGSPTPQGTPNMQFANPAAAPSQPTNSVAPAGPAANIRTISDEPKRPIVSIGSMLALDGQSLGAEKGIVRLRISGLTLPVEVLEWNDGSVKIQLPTLDLTEAMNADLEVLRADGRLASKSAIELSPAATRLALGN